MQRIDKKKTKFLPKFTRKDVPKDSTAVKPSSTNLNVETVVEREQIIPQQVITPVEPASSSEFTKISQSSSEVVNSDADSGILPPLTQTITIPTGFQKQAIAIRIPTATPTFFPISVQEQYKEDIITENDRTVSVSKTKQKVVILDDTPEVEALTLSQIISGKFSQPNESAIHIKLTEQKRKERLKKKQKLSELRPDIEDEIPSTKSEPKIVSEHVEGPKIKMVNGSIQIDQDSLFIHQGVDDAPDLEVVDETTGKSINSFTFRTKPLARMKWNAALTDLFFQGLTYFGTDFSMITVFINSHYDILKGMEYVTRRHVKLKFDSEEKHSSQAITTAIVYKKKATPEICNRMRAYMKAKKDFESMQPNPEVAVEVTKDEVDETTVVKISSPHVKASLPTIKSPASPLLPAPLIRMDIDTSLTTYNEPLIDEDVPIQTPSFLKRSKPKGVKLNLKSRIKRDA